MRFNRQLAALNALLWAATPAFGAVMPLDEAAKLFGVRQGAMAADLSPLGDKVVYLSSAGGTRTIVKLLDLGTYKERNVIASEGTPESLEWCEFATESWLVCRYAGNTRYENLVIGFGRLVAINLDKNELKPLGVREDFDRDEDIRQEDGNILDWLTDGDSASVLMARNHVAQRSETGTALAAASGGGMAVEKIELASMHVSTVEPARVNAAMFMTDGKGKVRLVGVDEVGGWGGQLSGKRKFRFRLANAKDWRDLGTYNSRDDSGLWPLAIDQSTDSLYYLEKHDGRDALFSRKLDGTNASSLIAKNDQVDISGVVRVSRGQPVIGYRYTDDRRRIEYFDPAYKKLATALGRALPDSPIIDFTGASRDGSKLLVHGSADTSAGTYYILNRANRHMEAILADRPELDGKPLAPVQSVSFAVADGTKIPAYLTLPIGGGKNLPTVVLPHGGPSARDEWGFDWLAQFLAARGYAVIQPNYRGSAGFGDKFLGENAFRD